MPKKSCHTSRNLELSTRGIRAHGPPFAWCLLLPTVALTHIASYDPHSHPVSKVVFLSPQYVGILHQNTAPPSLSWVMCLDSPKCPQINVLLFCFHTLKYNIWEKSHTNGMIWTEPYICPCKAAWNATKTVSGRQFLPTYHHPRSSHHPGVPEPASNTVLHQPLHKRLWSPQPAIIRVWESFKWRESVKQLWWKKKLSKLKLEWQPEGVAATKSWVLTFNTTAGFSLNRHQLA